MADRSDARIELSGAIPCGALKQLIRAINDDGATPHDADHFEDDDDIIGCIADSIGAVILLGSQLAGGEFPNVQAVCEANGLSYRLIHESCNAGGYGPGIRLFTPASVVAASVSEATGEPAVTLSDLDRYELADVAAVRDHLTRLATPLAERLTLPADHDGHL